MSTDHFEWELDPMQNAALENARCLGIAQTINNLLSSADTFQLAGNDKFSQSMRAAVDAIWGSLQCGGEAEGVNEELERILKFEEFRQTVGSVE
jgi:hypothetical protein